MYKRQEVQALTEYLKSTDSQTREPVFAQTAASRTEPEWGATYVEIDLTNQHVYMTKDGAVVWDAPCVTGNVSKNYTTPPGIYSLTYKAVSYTHLAGRHFRRRAGLAPGEG